MNILTENYKLYNGDCLEVMDRLIENGVVVDMILCDPPYAKTRGKWDVIIPLDKMWERLNKLIKPNGAVCIFGNEPYSSMVRASNFADYKYDWKWVKNRATGFANCNYRPMSRYEDIMVFSKANASSGGKKNSMVYNPQGLIASGKVKKNTPKRHGLIQNDTNNVGKNNALMQETEYVQKFTNYPDNILEFSCEQKYVHPTQKPTALLEYLLSTYTQENELILDFTMGSGSTGVACMNLNRRFIGIELDEKYFNIGVNRIFENYGNE
jgi:site-specific DNA-methyltransferase (adenine-specific)